MLIQNNPKSSRKRLRFVPAAFALVLVVTGLAMGSSPPKPVWMKLFDGKDLSGWGYQADYWHVDSGMLQGQGKATYNTFCHTNRKYSDFVLSVKARLWQTPAGYTNSGLQYRSDFLDSTAHRMKGYQVDIGDGLDGSMYPEGAYPTDANMVLNDPCRKFINANGWNQFLVTANGGRVRHELNGNFCAEYTASVLNGYIGLQLHATDLVMKVDFKDVFIRPLNNSFAIPDSAAVTLDDSYSATAGLVPQTLAANAAIGVTGNTLFIPASFLAGGSSAIKVSLRDFQGRTVFSRPVRADAGVPMEISLPALGAGSHILSVTGDGNAFSGIVPRAR
ncbi:MAG: hypothetical protein JWO30_100 [Fibrobacteres bacterium]|nr:hypothetical protein [Fibrobacterota bacterium]